MVQILGTPKVQYFKTGTVDYLSGGKLYSYNAGTTTPKATYPNIADALAGTNANTNPVILDARGEADVVVKGPTKLILKDANDNIIWTVDNVDQSTNDIIDENGNEILKFASVADAVNEITITNASTSNAPEIAATGDDVNVALQVTSKGSGTLKLDAGGTGTVDIGTSSTGQINLKRNTAVTGTLAVSSSATVTGNLAVTANTTLTGTLGVTAASTFTGAITANGTLTANSTVNFVPTGLILAFGGTSAPTGFLNCDGTAVSRTTYPLLFAAIGTTWGSGDGSTTFNLPDLRRKTLVGSGGSGTGTLGNAVGNTGGTETVTLTGANMPSGVGVSSPGSPAGASYSPGSGFVGLYTSGSWTGGSATAVNIMQPSSVVMYIIRSI